MIGESPLLNNEISGFDLNDEQKNENYTRELTALYNEITTDLQKADHSGTGRVTEEELLDYLQSKLPEGKDLNVSLFRQLFQDLERSNNDLTIDLNDFGKKYIQAHEEMQLNYETLKKGFDKEKITKTQLEEKIQEMKQEQLNKNGISPNACVSTEIGKINFLHPLSYDEVFCEVELDNNISQKTKVKSIENPIFLEKFTFHIEDKQSKLFYRIYGKGNGDELIGEIEVPLCIINMENEEISPEFELKDSFTNNVAVFKPKLIIVTSYYLMYQKRYDSIDKNIESYQNKINQLSNELVDISLPYKKEFDLSQMRVAKGTHNLINNDNLVNGVEGVLKYAFKDKEVKWMATLKFILYFCILVLLLTSLEKPDFPSLFIDLTLLIIVNTEKTNYLFDYYKMWLTGIGIAIGYDVFDYLFLRNAEIDKMSSIDNFVKICGFLGFLGKLALLLAVFIVITKFKNTGKIAES